MRKHYKTEHTNSAIITRMTENVVFPKFDLHATCRLYSPGYIDGHLFYINTDYNGIAENHLTVSWDMFYVGKRAANYQLDVQFQNEYVVQYKTIWPRALKVDWVDFDVRLVMISGVDGKLEETLYCMKVPQEFLPRFLDNENNLPYSLKFFTI